MKIIFRSAVLAALVIATSCGKDDTNSTGEQAEEKAELLENTPLEANTVSDNVIIEGSTKEDGATPTSNGAITLDVSNTSKTALIGEGFDVSLSSDGDIIGAYLRFKSEDGTSANSYYDIDLNSNSANFKSKKSGRKSLKKSISLAEKVDETILDVDFNATIAPGKFCYELCVYDAEGNISNPQEVCLKVEAWGGNSDAVGIWELTRTYADLSPNDFQEGNIEYCEKETAERSCNLDSFTVTFDREDCEKIEYFQIIMTDDGSYTEKFMEIDKTVITNVEIPEGMTMDDIVDSCMYPFTNNEAILTYDGEGKWAYKSDTDSFVFVEYNYKEVYDGETYEDSFEPGDGSLYYGAGGDNGEVKIVDGKLIVSNFEFRTSEFEK